MPAIGETTARGGDGLQLGDGQRGRIRLTWSASEGSRTLLRVDNALDREGLTDSVALADLLGRDRTQGPDGVVQATVSEDRRDREQSLFITGMKMKKAATCSFDTLGALIPAVRANAIELCRFHRPPSPNGGWPGQNRRRAPGSTASATGHACGFAPATRRAVRG